MAAACLALIILAFALAVPLTLLARRIGHHLNALDAPGVKGQTKAPPRRVPNTGGLAVFWSIALPIIAGLLLIHTPAAESLTARFPDLADHLPGLREMTTAALALLACTFALHILGLVDDRRPLPAIPKLFTMLAVALAASELTQTRLLTALDPHVGGRWLSVAITVLWFGVVTNAFNFLDNMDGLSAGVGATCAAFFLTIALMSPQPQWFVGAALALLIGALAGFLVFNFPWRVRARAVGGAPGHPGRSENRGASIFMGDSGSLVVGFLLAFLSTRITYLTPEAGRMIVPLPNGALRSIPEPTPTHWHVLFIPLIILAIPLYDFASVTVIRLSQGKSPFVGDLQHFSHRLVNHGLSRRAAVLVIYGCTAMTAIGAVALPSLEPWQAALVGVQTLLVLAVLATYEWKRAGGSALATPVLRAGSSSVSDSATGLSARQEKQA